MGICPDSPATPLKRSFNQVAFLVFLIHSTAILAHPSVSSASAVEDSFCRCLLCSVFAAVYLQYDFLPAFCTQDFCCFFRVVEDDVVAAVKGKGKDDFQVLMTFVQCSG